MRTANPFGLTNGREVREALIELVSSSVDTSDGTAFWQRLDALQAILPDAAGKAAAEEVGNAASAWVADAVTLAIDVAALVFPHLATGQPSHGADVTEPEVVSHD